MGYSLSVTWEVSFENLRFHGSVLRVHSVDRNCNSFTDELLYRLTGKRSPAWINRAAWVRTLSVSSSTKLALTD